MTVLTKYVQIQTRSGCDIQDITDQIEREVSNGDVQSGVVTVFCSSSTSSVTTIEYESGCLQDLERLLDEIAPEDQHYAHNARWGDGNGHSHLRSALLGPSLSIPFNQQRLALGTWQQVIHLDFDNKPRNRRILLQIIGE